MAVNTSHFSNRFDREKWLSLGTRSSGVARLIEKERPPFLNYYFHYFRCREISSCSILASLLCRTHRPCAIDLSSFLSLVSSFIPFPSPTPPSIHFDVFDKSPLASTCPCRACGAILRFVCVVLGNGTCSVSFFHSTQYV